MKILKQLAVAAVASAVLLTGCQNSFTGTTRDLAVLADINKSTATTGLGTPTVTASLTNTKNQQITIAYSEPVDQATILSSLTIRTLTAGTAATASAPATAYVQGSTITPTLQYVSGSTATLSLDLSGVTAGRLEVYIDSTKLTARNGALKLDLDGDKVKGEGQDDDFYTDFAIGQSAVAGSATVVAVPVIAGGSRDPRAGYTLAAGSFGLGTATTTSIYTTTLAVATGDTTNYGTMLDGAIAIEKYVPAANSVGSWTAVTKIGVYTPATGTYVATFGPSVEGDVYRVRVTNPASLVSTPTIQGFKQKTYTNSLYTSYELVGPYKAVVPAASAKEITAANQKLALIPTAQFDSNGLNGKVLLSVDLAYAGDKGIDLSTVTSSNIKIVDAKGNSIAWTGYTTAFTDPTPANTAVATKIILTLDPTYQKQNNSYYVAVTSGLKTVAGSTVTVNVLNNSARYFGDTGNVNSLTPYIGTLVLNDVSPMTF